MSTTRHTTRHHLNRQRRLAAVRTAEAAPEERRDLAAGSAPVRTPVRERPQKPEPPSAPKRAGNGKAKGKAKGKSDPAEATGRRTPVRISRLRGPRPVAARRVPPPLAVLCLLTLLLGAFAGWAFSQAQSLRDAAALQNTALLDPARTSEVKGQAEKAVNALFSYDQADPQSSRQAAGKLLTGKAVEQHRELLAPVLAQAEKQKTVVTTTVTESAVQRIDGDRARVLVFADQSSTGTAAGADTAGSYAGAMLAVDLVERDGSWKVTGIDTFSD
ncbi:hypothetical protein [Streptomyces sp. KLOTTS4A1]|uniref:hypothetical protein n=1 Tax=Streptomyces sp. KLOTTS4A1 TaxID=3390996 RepID=UPI0039F55301